MLRVLESESATDEGRPFFLSWHNFFFSHVRALGAHSLTHTLPMRTSFPTLATRWLASVRAPAVAASAAGTPSFTPHALFSSSPAPASSVPALADWATVDPDGGGWQAYNLGEVLRQ